MYQHLAFDQTRTGPPDKMAERDRLRNKLVDVGQRFVGFDKVVEGDTVKRRTAEKEKFLAVQEGVMKLERAMNSEIKRRVDANKQVQGLTEHLANDMLERLQGGLIVRIEKLATSIESLTLRASALEKGISQFRGELPSKLQVDTAALVKEISDLRRHVEADRKSRIERDTSLFRRLAEMETYESQQFDRGMENYRNAVDQLKTEIDNLARTEEVSDSRTEKFRTFILEEIAGMKNTLAVSSQAREQTDDEIVQAMNQYTNALQKGLHSANQRGSGF
jgi:ribosomal protein S15P/S13E